MKKIIENREFDVSKINKDVFFYPASKKEKLQQFEDFLMPRLQYYWIKQDKNQAALERIYIKEALSKL